MSAPTRPVIRFSLVGPWEGVDASDPFPFDTTGAELAALREARLFPVAPVAGARTLLTASMLASQVTDDEMAAPLFASLVVVEHDRAAKVRTTRDGEIVPDRRVRRRTFAWPDPQVGEVTFHEVTYTVPYPDAPLHVTFTFTTPNLPQVEEMEWVFDTIVGTAEWVDPDVVENGDS